MFDLDLLAVEGIPFVFLARATEYPSPAITLLILFSLKKLLGYGTYLGAESPRPSSPYLFSPQIQTTPYSSRQMLWVVLELKLTTQLQI
jgi:hypothetical protein